MNRKTAGYSAMIFSGVYAVIILLVYFAQTTAVRLDRLNQQAMQILDYNKFGLFFSYDLLGYGIMALSTFFIGLTIQPKNAPDKALKWLLNNSRYILYFLSYYAYAWFVFIRNARRRFDWYSCT